MTEQTTRRRVLAATGAALAAGPLVGRASASGTDLTEWFANTDGAAELVDATGQSTVDIEVGTSANGGAFGFDPPAVRVDPGATVRWTWTGKGGSHNVVAAGGAFESELVGESGHRFEWTATEGVTRYYCGPHKAMGMRGAVVAGDAEVTLPGDATATPTPAPGGESGGDGGSARDFDGWLADTSNYGGVVDARGQDEVRVKVGAEGNGGQFAFAPAAVHVDPGTTVVWEWVGTAGAYDVRHPDLDVASETVQGTGFEYAIRFDGDGLSKYTCSEYGDRGMRGVVLVGDGPQKVLSSGARAGLGGAAVVGAAALAGGVKLHGETTTRSDAA